MAKVGAVVTTRAQIEALPIGAAIRHRSGDLAERREGGWAWVEERGGSTDATGETAEEIAYWEPFTIEHLPGVTDDEERASRRGGEFKSADLAELVTLDHSLPSLRLLDGLRVRVNRVTTKNGDDWAHFRSDDFDSRVGGVELTLPTTCLRKIGNDEGKPTTIEYRGGTFDLVWTVEQLDALSAYSVILPLGPARHTPRTKIRDHAWIWNTAGLVSIERQYDNTCEAVLKNGAIVLHNGDDDHPSL